MWWRSTPFRAAIMAAPLALGGCLQPMYGQFSAGGAGLDDQLKLIAIEPIPDRIGHYLGDDLIFELNGSGSHPTPRYRLFVSLDESVQTPLIDTVTGLQSAATIVINANYRLERIDTGADLTHGKSFVLKSYDRTSERFANIRAARDAEIQNAQQLADELRIRIASYFAEHRQS